MTPLSIFKRKKVCSVQLSRADTTLRQLLVDLKKHKEEHWYKEFERAVAEMGFAADHLSVGQYMLLQRISERGWEKKNKKV